MYTNLGFGVVEKILKLPSMGKVIFEVHTDSDAPIPDSTVFIPAFQSLFRNAWMFMPLFFGRLERVEGKRSLRTPAF